MSEERKGLSNEKLPDPKSAPSELSKGGPRTRTAAHLKRIVAASLALPLAASTSLAQRGFLVVDPAPPPQIIPVVSARFVVKSPEIVVVGINRQAPAPMTAGSPTALAAGTHRIELTSASNATSFTIEIKVGPDRPPVDLTPPPVAAILKVVSPAEVKVDDKPATLVSPETAIELPAGTHAVVLTPTPRATSQAFTLEIVSTAR